MLFPAVLPRNLDTTAISPRLEILIEKIAKSEGRRDKGCVICFAAGNGNLPLDKVVTNPEFFVNGVTGSEIRNS